MEIITQFIGDNLYIVAAALYVLGAFFKKIPNIPDFIIPISLSLVGMVFGVLIDGTAAGLLQGILCAGAAVLVNQNIKQFSKKE